jgi:spoIIIJ-associated protein
MTAELEFKGKSVQKAVAAAAEALGIPEKKLQYDILSHGSTGIFGLAGFKKARIRVHSSQAAALPQESTLIDEGPLQETVAEKAEDTEPLASDDIIRLGKGVLRRIVDAISPESQITVQQTERRIKFSIEGGQSGILIGKRGQTLEAMQVIVDKAIRRVNGANIRLEIDVEDYLSKKKAGLVRTAERLADKVKTKGRPSSIGYLNAQDRRVVHLALKNNPNVRTKSVGEGPVRKLMIYPRHKSRTRAKG